LTLSLTMTTFEATATLFVEFAGVVPTTVGAASTGLAVVKEKA
jgi:hypothetical protein